MTGFVDQSRDQSAVIVRRLWQFCNVLRDDGLSYPDYIEQLTYLLFLKMADERRDGSIPPWLQWSSFADLSPVEMHERYTAILRDLSGHSTVLSAIFSNATNRIRDPHKLYSLVVDLIGPLEWNSLSADVKGDAYEGLLEKNARDTKSGAGQYFTPRAVVEAIVACIDPQLGQSVCDPACGTGGFLLASQRHLLDGSGIEASIVNATCAKAFKGVELVAEVARLATMNLFLHGLIDGASENLPIECRDSLSAIPRRKYDVILTNPPFGVKGANLRGGDRRGRTNGTGPDLRPDFWVATSNKQLNFIQHVVSMLAPGGRAAVVVPDNVLYEGGAASEVRRRLVTDLNLHTILRLPGGLFYAHGLMANVLFFENQKPVPDGNVWVYDLRGDTRFSVKTRPIQSSDLADFVACYRSERTGDAAGAAGSWWPVRLDDVRESEGFMLDLSRPARLSAVTPARSRSSLDRLSKAIVADLQAAIDQMTGLERD